MQTDIETKTDLRLVLSDPNNGERDFTNEISFVVTGMMRVVIGMPFRVPISLLREDEREEFGNLEDMFVLPWTVTAMDQKGKSSLGDVRVTNFEGRPTFGTVIPKTSEDIFPAILSAEVCAQVDLPDFGSLHTITPVPIKAEINAIPPFGVEAKHANRGTLVDENLQPKGMIVGNSITLIGPSK
ncbi:MAG TPA: hypothetical protein VK892_01730 [Pyrinomonadaceae bacterium]|nr:hypothetical protein [Pyrinomonadaceae bacterium]